MKRAIPGLIAMGCLAGCGGGGSGAPSAVAAGPPPAASVDFTAFTKNLVTTQPDSAVPIPVSVAEFAFRDDDNPAAFASVLPGP